MAVGAQDAGLEAGRERNRERGTKVIRYYLLTESSTYVYGCKVKGSNMNNASIKYFMILVILNYRGKTCSYKMFAMHTFNHVILHCCKISIEATSCLQIYMNCKIANKGTAR